MIVVTVLVGTLTPLGSPNPAAAVSYDSQVTGATSVRRQVFAGPDYTCMLNPEGHVWCWGKAAGGTIGYPEPVAPLRDRPPIDLGTGRTAVAIATGDSHMCAILDNGDLKCWGYSSGGILGLGGPGQMGDNLAPIDLGTGRTAVAVAAGSAHTCAVLDNGDLKCWGYNNRGQLGLGDTAPRGGNPGEMGDNLPAVDLGTGRTAVTVSAGANSTCAILDNGDLKCWGYNPSGILGLGDTAPRGDNPGEMGDNLPAVDLGTGRTATSVVISAIQTCAILDNGNLKCWGTGSLGQGDNSRRGDDPGEMGDNLPPIDLGRGRTVTQVAIGRYHTCALLNGGDVKCWGSNTYGTIGSGSGETLGDDPGEMGDYLPRVALGSFLDATSLAAGGTHTCVTLSNETTKCWGFGPNGELGPDTGRAGSNRNEMGDNLPAVNVGDAPSWIECANHQPVGYYLIGSTGRIHNFGDATRYIDFDRRGPEERMLDIESSPTGCGVWVLTSGWWIRERGGVPWAGLIDYGTRGINEEPATISPTPSGQGLWVFTNKGRVLFRGDAEPKYSGDIYDLSGMVLLRPIIDSVATPSGEGYYMLASDGGVFAFGDARFAGSLPGLGITPDKPVVGLVPDPDGYGYWLVAADGGVFAFGAPFVGSLPGLGITRLDAPIVGMTAYADGYLQVASDGGVFNFSSLPFSGSLGGVSYNPDIVAITPAWRPR